MPKKTCVVFVQYMAQVANTGMTKCMYCIYSSSWFFLNPNVLRFSYFLFLHKN